MGQKLTKKYSKVTNLFYLKTINLFTVYFVYNFYNFKYLINKRQQSALIICAIRTTRIKLINLFFFMMKNFKSQLKNLYFNTYIDSQKKLFIPQKTYSSPYSSLIFDPWQESLSYRFLYFNLYKDYLGPLAGIDVLAFYISAYTKIIFNPWRESMC